MLISKIFCYLLLNMYRHFDCMYVWLPPVLCAYEIQQRTSGTLELEL